MTRSEAASLVTQASYSQLILDQLERANLFLVPLDDERHWYRYHHLFAEVLRSRLTSGASAETVATFHGRASVWYEQQGLIAEAVQHALAAHDWQRAADMIEAHGPGMALRGQVHIVLDWLNVLPDALMRMRPALCIIHALTLMFTDQLDAAEARLQDAERCVQPNMPPDQTQAILGRVAVIRANLVRYFGDLPRAVTLAQQALDLLPEADTIARAPAIIGVARIYLVSGDVTPAAERLAAAAVAPARASGNLLAFLSSVTNLARLQMMQGRLRQAAATFGDTTQLAPGPGRLEALVGSPAYYFGLGDLFREWNDLDAAEHHVAQGMNLVGGTLAVDADVVTLGYVAQAYVQHARRDTSGALATLEQFANLARQRNFVAPLIACGAATQAQLWLAQGQLAAAARWAEASGLQANDLNLPFPREAEYLTFARVQIALQRDGVAPPALADTVRLLDRLLVGAKANGRMGSVIELLMVRALALDAQGQLAEALSALEHALSLAEPEGYVRTFVDAGAPMAALLAQVARDTSPVATYAATLLVAFPEQYKETRRQGNKDYGSSNLASISPLLPFSPSPGLVEPLSAREREILQLIAGGLSNQAIADQLVVAASTVKKHINNIYGKLDVQSRTQALLRARELNLL